MMTIRRTPVTWAVYGATGAWAAFIYLTGPISPVLTEDLGVAAGYAGLIGTAVAIGAITAAAAGPAALRRLDRGGTMLLGLGILALGALALATLPQLLDGWPAYALVLLLVWFSAVGGATSLNVGTARLSDLHPEHSAIAITEANAAAAWVGVFSPLVLGAALAAGLGWWVGFAVAAAVAVTAITGLVVAGRRQPASAEHDPHVPAGHRTMVVADEIYEAPRQDDATTDALSTGLPARFWVAMVALFAAVGTEFAVNFMGSPLIQEHTDATASAATSAISASILGVAIGRTVGTKVAQRLGPHRTVLAGFGLTLLGFATLWTARVLPVAVVGLFVVGLGLATLFPLLIDRAIGLSEGRPDTAMSRASLVLGFATGGAPFVLAALGAVVGVGTAMLLVPVLIGVGIVGVVASRPTIR